MFNKNILTTLEKFKILELMQKKWLKISSYLPQEFSHSSSVRKPFGVLPQPTVAKSLHFLSVSSNINPSNIWGQSPHTGFPLQWLSANDKTLLWYYIAYLWINIVITCASVTINSSYLMSWRIATFKIVWAPFIARTWSASNTSVMVFTNYKMDGTE